MIVCGEVWKFFDVWGDLKRGRECIGVVVVRRVARFVSRVDVDGGDKGDGCDWEFDWI